jgi:hypothetical protein
MIARSSAKRRRLAIGAAALAAAASLLSILEGALAQEQERHADASRTLASSAVASANGAAHNTRFRCAELLILDELSFQREFRSAVGSGQEIDAIMAEVTERAGAKAEQVRRRLDASLDPSLGLDEDALAGITPADCSDAGVSSSEAVAKRLLERQAVEVDRASNVGRLRGRATMGLALTAVAAALLALRQATGPKGHVRSTRPTSDSNRR